MVVIGITGGIASGKSLVAQQLRQLGAVVLDADAVGHEVLQDPSVRAALCARWGSGILDQEGEICRRAVADKVFAPPPEGPQELAFLEQWTHPRITERIGKQLQALRRRSDCPVAVLDAPLLYKAGWEALCDVVLFVEADAALRAARARQRGWSETQWRTREAAQPALDAQRARASLVLDNSGSPAHLAAQVERFWRSLPGECRPTFFKESPFTNCQENP
ncbi:MAG: dephospho-CoA kinase [Pirellulaceae bacterium]